MNNLSSFLHERCNVLREASSSEGQQFILYLSTCALRTYENPALDVAVALSKSTNKPLIVHSFFDDRSLHATARRAVFVIESIRELETKYNEMGLHFTFQLIGCPNTSRAPAYLTLASRATHVVTDEPFVEPHLTTVRRLERIKSATLITVDTSLEIPARMISSSHVHRAYTYRNATTKEFQKRCRQPYPVSSLAGLPTLSSLIKANLPTRLFLDLTQHPSTRDLVQSCPALDHSVVPVDHTRGGMEAGKVRWSSFLRRGLKQYHKTRNNPLQHHQQGVSRISPYLNLGILSPFKVSRDACQTLSSSSSSSSTSSSSTSSSSTSIANNKFLEEFAVFRGQAYSFCYHNKQHRHSAKDALPTWAYRTLQKHSSDRRTALLSLQVLKTAQTGVPLWDICQKMLVETGELHNNLRMTWGKEVLNWCSGPEQAYQHLLYLNDHYALDGMSPPSIAGVLWCLGWSDSPKEERNIFGTVRFRSAKTNRYDLKALDKQWRVLKSGAVGGNNLFAAFRRGGGAGSGVKRKREHVGGGGGGGESVSVSASASVSEKTKKKKTGPTEGTCSSMMQKWLRQKDK